jgi:AcrR family transcriptional regulator
MSDSSATAAETRGARRRAKTRAQLVEAARTLFARDGVEPVRINEITEEADVGFGSFYNHFASKDEIVAAVVGETMAEHGERLDALAEVLDDPAEVVAVAHRHFVDLARTEPETGWLAVRLELTHGVLAQAVGHRAVRDLERGVAEGRFDVEDVPVAFAATGGALLFVMRAVLEGVLGEDAGVVHAERVLRMLGVDAADAAEVARRPLPDTA